MYWEIHFYYSQTVSVVVNQLYIVVTNENESFVLNND